MGERNKINRPQCASSTSGFQIVVRALASITIFLLSACAQMNRPDSGYSDCSAIPELAQGKLLLFGEMHGSIESPALIARLACSFSESREVAVGLEIKTSEQSSIDAYLASRGTSADREKLTSTAFWQDTRDGRASEAMLGLIETVRELKSRGKPVSVFAFDDQPGTDLERDVAIANGIRRFHLAHRNSTIIALMGNIHAMQKPFVLGEKELMPSGVLLKDLSPVSVYIAYPAGTISACMPECGTHVTKPVKGATGSFAIETGSPLGGYDYTIFLASISASPPFAGN